MEALGKWLAKLLEWIASKDSKERKLAKKDEDDATKNVEELEK